MAYTYLLRHKPTGHLYYGVRWAGECSPDEFWKSYFTSSLTMIPLFRTLWGDDCWEWEIRKTFETTKAARAWEHKVLRRMKVLKSPHVWLNRTDNKAIEPTSALKGIVGSRWAHNGIKNIKLQKNESLPEGYMYGRLIPFLAANQGRKGKGPHWTETQKNKHSITMKLLYASGKRVPWNKGMSIHE